MKLHVGRGKAENKYSEAVAVTLGRSGRAAAAVAFAALATLVVLTLTPLAPALRAGLALAVLVSALDAYRRIALRRGASTVTGLRIDRTRAIEVDPVCGRRLGGVVRAGCFVAPWLTIVRWRPEGAWVDRTILILPDMLAKEQFRELRVMLRWS